MIFRKSLFYLLTFFSCTHVTHEMGTHSLSDTKAKQQIAMWADYLPGTWLLAQTIRYEQGDTIIQEPVLQSWLSPGAQPFTTMVLDTAKHFSITQACMKCPVLEWEGQYEITVTGSQDHCYLNFFDARQTKKARKEVSITADFNGLLKSCSNDQLVIIDRKRCEWVYKRQSK